MANNIGTVLGKDKRRLNDTIEQLGTVNVATYFENYFESIKVRESNIKADEKNITGTTLILGHPTVGSLGTYYLGTIGNNMVWGHPSLATWNSYLWGTTTRNSVRILEAYHYLDLTLDFSTTDYESASNTASGFGTGSLVVGSEGTFGAGISLLDSESFETGFGGWTNSVSDQLQWSRETFTTPSNNTGPSTAYDDTYYVYVETSSPASVGDEAHLEYDLGGTYDGYVDFWYHMYGAAMGSLILQGWDGATWTEIWSLSGDQGNSWYQATTPDTDFSGYSKLRFVGICGTSFTSDMAIDLVKIYSGTPNTKDIFQTTNLVADLDIQLNTTKFDRMQVNPSGSYVNFMSGSYSTDNGTTWYGINPYEETQLVSPGSELIFRAINNYGSEMVFDDIRFIIKQDDF